MDLDKLVHGHVSKRAQTGIDKKDGNSRGTNASNSEIGGSRPGARTGASVGASSSIVAPHAPRPPPSNRVTPPFPRPHGPSISNEEHRGLNTPERVSAPYFAGASSSSAGAMGARGVGIPSHPAPRQSSPQSPAGVQNSEDQKANGFSCNFCSRKFDSKETYQSHLAVFHRRSRTPGKPLPSAFNCPHCGKGFTSPSKVSAHVDATHLHLRPFECDICKKAFGYKDVLTCPSIVLVFPLSGLGDLLKHKTTHTGVKEYRCYICGAQFSRNFYVKRHILTVHEKGKQ